MDFKEALDTVIKKNRCEILKDNFRVRSILCDYVGFSPYQVKLVNIFCEIYKEYDLVQIFKDKGLIEGRRYLKTVYPKFVNICTFVDYKEAINPLSEIICPEEYSKYNANQSKKINKVVIVKNVSKKQAQPLTNQPVLSQPFNSIKGINIITEVKSVKIDYFDEKGKPYKDVKFYYKNNKNRSPISTKNYSVKSDILYINSKKTKQELVIGLPVNMKLDSLDIKTNNTNINICSSIKIDKTNIITESGNVEAQVSGTDLNVNTKSGMISININTLNTTCDSLDGTIFFCVYPIQKRKMNVNLSSSSGNIIGFLGFKARMKITGLFNKRGLVTSKVKEGRCQVNYRLSAPKGKISIR